MACPVFVKAQESPFADAVLWGRRRISWQHFDGYVHSTSRYLKEVGLKKGDRAAVLGVFSVEYAIIVWACWRVGIAVVLDGAFLDELGVRVVFKDDRVALPLKKKGVRIFDLKYSVAFESIDGFLGRDELIAPQLSLDQPAVVTFKDGKVEGQSILDVLSTTDITPEVMAVVEVLSNCKS
ncbi:MAG: AMP-binding protein [Candidatus Omnitrophica bacterium]|nr:AMP-binding protein [Candidatus Omnitrophota bacterium]